jgi:hypothetical protein
MPSQTSRKVIVLSMIQCCNVQFWRAGQPGNPSQTGFGTSTKGYVDKGSDTRITRRDRQRSIKDLPCALAEIEVADLVSPWMCDGAEPLVGDLTASSINFISVHINVDISF